MSKPFKPRKKKAVKVYNRAEMKFIRIDNRTQIEVPANMPDSVARERYQDRYKLGNKPPEKFIPPIEGIKYPEMPIGSLEDIEARVEPIIPEIE